jgi:hypothetical protein
MSEKTPKIMKVLVILVSVTLFLHLYLIFVTHAARKNAKHAMFYAMQAATNSSGVHNNSNMLAQLSSKILQIQLQTTRCSLCPSQRDIRALHAEVAKIRAICAKGGKSSK